MADNDPTGVDPSCGCPLRAAAKRATKAAGAPDENVPVTQIDPSAESPNGITRLPTMTPLGSTTPGSVGGPRGCITSTADGFWLRPRVTFDRIGHHYPKGTSVKIISAQPFTHGIYRAYYAEVMAPAAGEPSTGFAWFRLADVALCFLGASSSDVMLLLDFGKSEGDKAP